MYVVNNPMLSGVDFLRQQEKEADEEAEIVMCIWVDQSASGGKGATHDGSSSAVLLQEVVPGVRRRMIVEAYSRTLSGLCFVANDVSYHRRMMTS